MFSETGVLSKILTVKITIRDVMNAGSNSYGKNGIFEYIREEIPPVKIPKIAAFFVVLFQNKEQRIIGPIAAPSPAQA